MRVNELLSFGIQFDIYCIEAYTRIKFLECVESNLDTTFIRPDAQGKLVIDLTQHTKFLDNLCFFGQNDCLVLRGSFINVRSSVQRFLSARANLIYFSEFSTKKDIFFYGSFSYEVSFFSILYGASRPLYFYILQMYASYIERSLFTDGFSSIAYMPEIGQFRLLMLQYFMMPLYSNDIYLF